MEGSPNGAPPPAETRSPEVKLSEAREIVRAFPTVAQRVDVGLRTSRGLIQNAQATNRFAEGSPWANLTVAPEGGQSLLDRAGTGGEAELLTGASREAPIEQRVAQSEMIQARMQVLAEMATPIPGKDAEGDTPAIEAVPGDQYALFALDILRDDVVVEIPTEGQPIGEMFSLQEWQGRLNAAGEKGSPERTALEKQGIWKFKDEAPEEAPEAQAEKLTTRQVFEREQKKLATKLEELKESPPEDTDDAEADAQARKEWRAERKAVRESLQQMAIAARAEGMYGAVMRQQLMAKTQEAGMSEFTPEEIAQVNADALGPDGQPLPPFAEMLESSLENSKASKDIIALFKNSKAPIAETMIKASVKLKEAMRESETFNALLFRGRGESQTAFTDKMGEVNALIDPKNLVLALELARKGKGILLSLLAMLGLNLTNIILEDAGIRT